jgi:hypothetical protein
LAVEAGPAWRKTEAEVGFHGCGAGAAVELPNGELRRRRRLPRHFLHYRCSRRRWDWIRGGLSRARRLDWEREWSVHWEREECEQRSVPLWQFALKADMGRACFFFEIRLPLAPASASRLLLATLTEIDDKGR